VATTNINTVVITGNLTRDPELRSLPSGMSVCEMGVAVNESVKNNQTGQWEERANFFDVTVWGAQGENCARFLAKGRPVAVHGRLRWEQWQSPQGENRSKVKIVADRVQFLGGREEGQGGGGFGQQQQPSYNAPPQQDVYGGDFAAPPVGVANGNGAQQAAPQPPADDDIPF
jgi:single-strand DNA-binding protein